MKRDNGIMLFLQFFLLLSSTDLLPSYRKLESFDSGVKKAIPSLQDQNLVPLISEFTGPVLVSPRLVATFYNFGSCIKTVRFNKDSTKLIGVSINNGISIWDIKSERRLQEFPMGLCYPDAAFDEDGETILTKINDQAFLVWKKQNGKYKQYNRINGSIPHPETHPFISLLYRGRDNAVHFVDRETGRCKMVLEAHGNAIEFAQFNQTGDLLVTAGCDSRVKVWRVGKTPQEIMEEVSMWCKVKKIMSCLF